MERLSALLWLPARGAKTSASFGGTCQWPLPDLGCLSCTQWLAGWPVERSRRIVKFSHLMQAIPPGAGGQADEGPDA